MWLSYDDTYEVSDEGQVRNKRTKYIKQASYSHDGYLIVFMKCYDTCKRVHRLVAERFLPAPTTHNAEIDHIDRDKTNNSASNLRWVSHLENCQNKGNYTNNTSGYKHIVKRNISSYRVQIKSRGSLVFTKTYSTLEEAIVARDTFISSSLQSSP
jgi:hypothetical protein